MAETLIYRRKKKAPWVGKNSGPQGPDGPDGPAGPQGPDGESGLSELVCTHCFSFDESTASGGFSGEKIFTTFGRMVSYRMVPPDAYIHHLFFLHPKSITPVVFDISVNFVYRGDPILAGSAVWQASIRGFDDFEKINKAMTLTNFTKNYTAADGDAMIIGELPGYSGIGNLNPCNPCFMELRLFSTTQPDGRYWSSMVTYPIQGGL